MRQPDTIMMYVLLQDVSHPDVVHNHDVVSLMELWNLGDQFASYCLCLTNWIKHLELYKLPDLSCYSRDLDEAFFSLLVDKEKDRDWLLFPGWRLHLHFPKFHYWEDRRGDQVHHQRHQRRPPLRQSRVNQVREVLLVKWPFLEIIQ